jgi:hypothetical protein
MTTQQPYLFGGLYLVILTVVAVLTGATPRRIAGAMVGGAFVGVALLGIVALGEKAGWWHMAITWEPYFLTLMCIRHDPWVGSSSSSNGVSPAGSAGVVSRCTRSPPRFLGRCGTTAIWQPSRSGAPTRQGLPRVCNFYGVCHPGPRNDAAGRQALPRQAGWRAGHGNQPDAPSFESGTPEPHFADCARMTGYPSVIR